MLKFTIDGGSIEWEYTSTYERRDNGLRSYKYKAVVDGVTIYRSETRCALIGEGLVMKATPKKGQSLDDVAAVMARLENDARAKKAAVA